MQPSTFICKGSIDCRDFIRIKGYNVHSVASLCIIHTQTFLAQDMYGEIEKSELKGRDFPGRGTKRVERQGQRMVKGADFKVR